VGDLSRSGVDVVMCDPSAPCGALGRQVLQLAGVRVRPRSLEPDVKSVLTKVELGEADAGLVYTSDAASAGAKVRALPIPNSSEALNTYLVAPVAGAHAPGAADEWIHLVTSPEGRRVLRGHGFGPP
jgi:molybdate transport system substrate-binding protein